MIFLARAKLVILLEPKTGTTALEKALVKRAAIVVRQPAELKHMSYRGFMKFIAPWIEHQAGMRREDYTVVSVMREPLDWLGSWYRYRSKHNPDTPKSRLYTGDMSFDQFVNDVCKPHKEKPVYARMRTPSWVALGGKHSIGTDRLFPYEDLSGLYELINERTGKAVAPNALNVSPKIDTTVGGGTMELLHRHFAFDFDLHASLSRDGTIDDRFRSHQHHDELEDLAPAYSADLH